MKSKIWFTLVSLLVVSMLLAACAPAQAPAGSNQQAPSQPAIPQGSADLSLLGSSTSKLFLGNDFQSEGLLQEFYKESGFKVFVQYGVGGPEAEAIKTSTIGIPTDNKTPETFDGFIFDDQIFGSGLKDTVYPAQSEVGVWIRQDKATSLGLAATNPYLTHEKYAQMLETGQLNAVTAPASKSTAALLEFFATLAACSKNPAAPLTVKTAEDNKDCGKRIYDHYARSTGSTGDAVSLVFNDSLSGTNMLDGVVAFQSSFAGKNGLNQQLIDKGKQPFIFFNFSDASPVATMVMGNSGNLTEAEKKVYDAFSAFLISEKAQQAIASYAIMSGSSAFGVSIPDQSAFKAEWGLLTSPTGTPINPPVYTVAKKVIEIYSQFYKKAKVVNVCVDVSPSMFSEHMTVNYNGKDYVVTRIQALNIAIQKFTSSKWLADNQIVPGDTTFQYYFFSTDMTGLVAETKGKDTDQAGALFNSILGPLDNQDPGKGWSENGVLQALYDRFNHFQPNGTAMFDCADAMLNKVTNTDADQYIVILTDGKNMSGLKKDSFFSNWDANPNKKGITLIGILFGTPENESDLKAEYTKKFGGNTYSGDDSAALVAAFKAIYDR